MNNRILLACMIVPPLMLAAAVSGQDVSERVSNASRRLNQKEYALAEVAETTEALRLEYSSALRQYLVELPQVQQLDRATLDNFINIHFSRVRMGAEDRLRDWQEPPLVVLEQTLMELLQRQEAKVDRRLRCVLLDRLNEIRVDLGKYDEVIRDTKLIVTLLREESAERPWQGDIEGYGKIERSHETLVENWEMDFFVPGIRAPLDRMVSFRMVSPSQAQAIRTDPDLNGLGELDDAFAIYDGEKTFEDFEGKSWETPYESSGRQ